MNKIAAMFAGVLFATAAFAQKNDFGSALSVEVSKKIAESLNVSFEEEFRTCSNFSEAERFSHTLELNYKPLECLKIGAAYNLMNFNHETAGWEIRHRFFFYASGMLDIGRVKLSLRERYQSTYRAGVEETAERANPKLYLRSRLEARYNIAGSQFEPFASAEIYNSLNDPQGNGLDRWRGIVGASYNINPKNSLELYYRYTNHAHDEDESDQHIIGLGYSFSF